MHLSLWPPARRLHLFLTSALCLVGVALSACGDSAPALTAASGLPATITGRVYESFTAQSGEPLLDDVAVSVKHTGGSEYVARTDGEGFYRVAATVGSVTVTVTKAGYETKVSEFYLASDTSLNFSMVTLPDAGEPASPPGNTAW
jgi:hypothetical protein